MVKPTLQTGESTNNSVKFLQPPKIGCLEEGFEKAEAESWQGTATHQTQEPSRNISTGINYFNSRVILSKQFHFPRSSFCSCKMEKPEKHHVEGAALRVPTSCGNVESSPMRQLGNFCGAIKQVSDKLLGARPRVPWFSPKAASDYNTLTVGKRIPRCWPSPLFPKRMKDFLITFYNFISVTWCRCLIKSLVKKKKLCLISTHSTIIHWQMWISPAIYLHFLCVWHCVVR